MLPSEVWQAAGGRILRQYGLEKQALVGSTAAMGAGLGLGLGAVAGYYRDDPTKSVDHHLLRGLSGAVAGGLLGGGGGAAVGKAVAALAPELAAFTRRGPFPLSESLPYILGGNGGKPFTRQDLYQAAGQHLWKAWTHPVTRFVLGATVGSHVGQRVQSFYDRHNLVRNAAQHAQAEAPEEPNAAWLGAAMAREHMGPYSSSLDWTRPVKTAADEWWAPHSPAQRGALMPASEVWQEAGRQVLERYGLLSTPTEKVAVSADWINKMVTRAALNWEAPATREALEAFRSRQIQATTPMWADGKNLTGTVREHYNKRMAAEHIASVMRSHHDVSQMQTDLANALRDQQELRRQAGLSAGKVLLGGGLVGSGALLGALATRPVAQAPSELRRTHQDTAGALDSIDASVEKARGLVATLQAPSKQAQYDVLRQYGLLPESAKDGFVRLDVRKSPNWL